MPFNFVNQLFVELQNQVAEENDPDKQQGQMKEYQRMVKSPSMPKLPDMPKISAPKIG